MRMRNAHSLSRRQSSTSCRFFASVWLYTAIWLGASAPLKADIVVDGYAQEPEWAHAVACTDWLRVEPFALDEPRYRNRMSIVATRTGLAVFFAFEHPPSERRIKPRSPRDAERIIGESLMLVVDFDASGQIAYEFSLSLGSSVRDGQVTNQNRFDRDWDGVWHHAVRETEDEWFAELLIPWSSVTMRNSTAATRTIAVYASRGLYDRAERYACPGLDSEGATFLSDFMRMEIEQYDSDALIDVVPYASLNFDQLNDRTHFKAGADFSWKPSAQFWLAATLNPDFGQVESDELVINFTAIETVFTDKRPFFTENHAVFDLRTPANGQLIYTRRIGAQRDDGSGRAADIDAGLKLTGAAGKWVYGAFAAQEAKHESDLGRSFMATRLALPLESFRIGHLTTYAQRPFLRRDALINAIDVELTPSESWRFALQGVRSDIDVAGVGTDGYLAWAELNLARSAPLTHSLQWLYVDRRFDLNDMGYMERNSLRQWEWETKRRIASERDRERVSGESQRFYAQYRENMEGTRLPSRVQLSRDVMYTSAWRAYQELRYLPGGVDDLISRGNGPVKLPDRYAFYADIATPRLGDWVWRFGTYVFQQGVEGLSAYLQLIAAWYPSEMLTVRAVLQPQWTEDWLLWERDNAFGGYEAQRLDLDLRIDWIPMPQHELRLKLQWIGVDAEQRRAYLATPRGDLARRSDASPPFTVSNFGLQLRYRFELGPMSELFVVYGRGGFQQILDDERDLGGLFSDIPKVRDADQFLIKFRYRL